MTEKLLNHLLWRYSIHIAPYLVLAITYLRWILRPRAPRRHNLDGKLYISLTSFSPRFGRLHLTLHSLLSQKVSPDGVILWIARDDVQLLPPEVIRLQNFGLIIEVCEDLRSYKKLVPALRHPLYSASYIVTADDDLYYPNDWLSDLVSTSSSNTQRIVCHRAHILKTLSDGSIDLYENWEHETRETGPSPRLVPTTGAGVLFPPNALPDLASNATVFSKLAPTSDDLWFYWMARLNKVEVVRIAKRSLLVNWPSTQANSLYSHNCRDGGNDLAIEKLVNFFGSPL